MFRQHTSTGGIFLRLQFVNIWIASKSGRFSLFWVLEQRLPKQRQF